MKLLFPGGEHPQVLVGQGTLQVGSDPDAGIVLASPDTAARHAELRREGDALSVHALEGTVTINGQALGMGGSSGLKAGDLVGFGKVQARLVEIEKAGTAPAPARPAPVDEMGATRVRIAVPRFVLRGVSGAAFGKVFPVMTQQVIGRQSDCDIAIPSEEISRRHAQVKPTPVGLMVEDLGSSNGTYINGQRVQQGLLKPGEELRLDNIRFLLVAPGAQVPATSTLAKGNEPAAKKGGSGAGWIAVALVALAAAGVAAWYLFLR